ncbi:MAG: hypothetical protein LBC47_07050 [Tannerella sp.]|jgi:hypothetical protein|nr:hypothetical protein [Tannerella sp.]
MARYLDPKNDLIFKRIFGEHPRLLVSFLNALMPLAPDRRMAVLWLRFLSEVEDRTENISPDLLENEEIKEALTLCEEAAFTTKEREWYEYYWDLVRTEKGLVETAKAEGLAEGRAISLAKGEAKGQERTVLTAYQNNFSIEQIRMFSGLNEDAILEILKRNDCMNN